MYEKIKKSLKFFKVGSSAFIFVFCLIASGCATVKYSYKDKNTPDYEVAKLRQSKVNNGWRAYFSDYIDLNKGSEKRWQSVGNHFTGFSSSMNFLQGKYVVRFMCSTGASVAYPVLDLSLEKGEIYSVRCFNAVGGTVGVEVKESNINSVEM